MRVDRRASVGIVTRRSRADKADSNLRMISAACEDFERSSGQWIVHPSTGERLWVRAARDAPRRRRLEPPTGLRRWDHPRLPPRKQMYPLPFGVFGLRALGCLEFKVLGFMV